MLLVFLSLSLFYFLTTGMRVMVDDDENKYVAAQV
jgi:hypothetical protein